MAHSLFFTQRILVVAKRWLAVWNSASDFVTCISVSLILPPYTRTIQGSINNWIVEWNKIPTSTDEMGNEPHSKFSRQFVYAQREWDGRGSEREYFRFVVDCTTYSAIMIDKCKDKSIIFQMIRRCNKNYKGDGDNNECGNMSNTLSWETHLLFVTTLSHFRYKHCWRGTDKLFPFESIFETSVSHFSECCN